MTGFLQQQASSSLAHESYRLRGRLGHAGDLGSDPWENTAGRVHLRGRHGENVNVSLGAAAQKKFDAISSRNRGDGVQISLSDFRSRMGPVRDDRDPGAHLSLTLQILLAKDAPNLSFGIQALQNRSPYWDVESIEWPLRLFPVRTVEDEGYIVFPEQEGMLIPSRFEQGYFRYLNWIWERIAGQAAVFDQSSMPWYGENWAPVPSCVSSETPDDVAYGMIANDGGPGKNKQKKKKRFPPPPPSVESAPLAERRGDQSKENSAMRASPIISSSRTATTWRCARPIAPTPRKPASCSH